MGPGLAASLDLASPPSAGARVFLLLEACGYEGFFVVGVFSSRERAERGRIEECLRVKSDPKADGIYRVKELALDATISEDLRYSRGFGVDPCSSP